MSSFEFFIESQKAQKPGLYFIGFPFDGTACFRKGGALGPKAVRDISYGIEGYSPYLDLDLEDYSNIYDLGDLQLVGKDQEEIFLSGMKSFEMIFSSLENKAILTFGGEHSISLAPIKMYLKQYEDLVLLHLDAHADLRDGYEGYHYSHASIIRRSLDHFGEGHTLKQYGIRSGTKEEYSWMKINKTLCRSRQEFLEFVEGIGNHRPIYLTLDLDYFDPSFFPGTGTPEAGGEDFHSFCSLLKILRKKNLVGADITELAPELDSSNNSAVFAAKVVRELSLVLADNLEKK